jgi:hypothetical protein
MNITARRVTVVGLLTGAVGLLMLRVAGQPMPAVPPGLVLLVTAGALVAFTRTRWAPLVGALVGMAEIAGFVFSGGVGGLVEGAPAIVAGSWIRVVGITAAAVAGIIATLRSAPRGAAPDRARA